jgi:hypothetical protein
MASTSAGTSVSSATSAKRAVRLLWQPGQLHPATHGEQAGQLHPGAQTRDCLATDSVRMASPVLLRAVIVVRWFATNNTKCQTQHNQRHVQRLADLEDDIETTKKSRTHLRTMESERQKTVTSKSYLERMQKHSSRLQTTMQ